VRAERYLWHYEDQVRDAIRTAKFKPHRGLVLWLARMLFLHGIRLFTTLDWSHIAYVPGSPQGVRSRGFDQAELMASHIGYQLELLVLRHIIRRSRTSVPQSKLGHSSRVIHGTRAFSLAPKTRLTNGARVLLIDDVSTTGISTHTIARLLLLSGAAAVDVLTLARSNSWSQYYGARASLKARV
jgi:ComF family protein